MALHKNEMDVDDDHDEEIAALLQVKATALQRSTRGNKKVIAANNNIQPDPVRAKSKRHLQWR